MPAQDTSGIKEKILFIIRTKGPSLPVHIASEIGLSILFTSAFLSELASEKKIKITNMKVGSSPVYFIPGQEILLKKFSQYLKSKEKDAYLLLEEKKILKDEEQEPAIRVALRAIQDFAIPFKKDEEIFWRFFAIPETEINIQKKEEPKKESQKEEKLDIFDNSQKEKESPIKKTSKKRAIKKTKKQSDKFFEEVKSFLSKKNIEILDIQSFNKTDLSLKIREDGKEKILIAYSKKRINEEEIIKASKKASIEGLPYIILSKGEPLKKLKNLIKAMKNLSEIEKID